MTCSDWINLVIAIATFGAAIGAFLSSRQTKKAMQAQIMANFLDEYSSDSMRKSLELLSEWKGLNKERTPIFEINNKKSDIGPARRQVKHFFFKAQRLKKAGYVDSTFVQQIASLAGFSLLFDVIEPLEREEKLTTQAGDHIYEDLRKLYLDNPITLGK